MISKKGINNLEKGDIVYLLSTSGYFYEDLSLLKKETDKFELKLEIGKTIGKRYNQFSGTDSERLDDFQYALDNPNIKAILFARGGYGAIRIMDKVNWDNFLKSPKWLIGFSEVTVIHSFVNNCLNHRTIHGPMPSTFKLNTKKSIHQLFSLLAGKKNEISFPVSKFNKKTSDLPCKGTLLGGNLTVIYSLLSVLDFDFSGAILFIEEVSVKAFQLDRMLISLKLSNKIEHIKALLIGGTVDIGLGDVNHKKFSQSIEEIILEVFSKYNFPIIFNAPIGHIKNNYSVILGAEYEIKNFNDKLILKTVN